MQKASCAIRKPVLCLSQLNGNVTDNDTDIVTENDANRGTSGKRSRLKLEAAEGERYKREPFKETDIGRKRTGEEQVI